MSAANVKLRKKALEDLRNQLKKDHLWPSSRYSNVPAKVKSRSSSPAPVKIGLHRSQSIEHEPSTVLTPRPSIENNSEKNAISESQAKPDFVKLNIESINRTPLRRSLSLNALHNETEADMNLKKRPHIVGQIPP